MKLIHPSQNPSPAVHVFSSRRGVLWVGTGLIKNQRSVGTPRALNRESAPGVPTERRCQFALLLPIKRPYGTKKTTRRCEIKFAISLIAALLFFIHAGAADALSIRNLRCEMLANPQGIGVTAPRFSWQLKADGRGIKQTAYQIIVASSQTLLEKNTGDVWSSGKVSSDSSHLVTYKGRPLQSRQQCFWKVMVWTNNGAASWSEPSSFSVGLLKPTDWKAKWIGLDRAFAWDSVSKFARLSARYFRKEAIIGKPVKRATVYLSGLGLYELHFNGKKVGNDVLAPAPTDYDKSILYNTYDVTPQLQRGANAIGVVLGNGRFFAMRQNYKPQKWHTYGFPRLLLQLEVEYADGTKQTITSDETWKATADGPIRTANEYDGEEYDATKELAGWNKAGYNTRSWLKADIVKAPGGKLSAQMNENMRVMDSVKPASIKSLSAGKYILDMGQNMAGWIKLKVNGKRGQKVTLRFAESLQPNGELYTANLRDAIVTDAYTLRGGGDEVWHPRFVYHGFRYVEVMGYPGTPTVDDFIGEVVYDGIATTGTLETSNNIINRIHQNAWWGIRGNYKGMPVDCPQRNERQPWLGDRTTGAYGESFLFDNGRLYAKWLNDIADAQTAEGSIPDVAPSFWFYYKDNMTWPGAFLTIADMLHRQYGDAAPIVAHYPAMKKWMGYMQRKYLMGGLMTKDTYGDWCVPPESLEMIHSRDSMRTTNPQLIATAYYYYLLGLLQRFAVMAGESKDIAAYKASAEAAKQAFNKTFYNAATSRYDNNTVTANLLPLAFGMMPDADSSKVFQNIVSKIVDENGGHISTGVIGTQWLMRWLTKLGRADLSYKLASNTSYPSWGYMVENGATTIWELWNGNTANPAMNSQNHVMLLGDLLIWMYEDLAGIKSDTGATGFKRIVMKPSFVKGLEFVNACHQSPYGMIKSEWKQSGGKLQWNVEVPVNTTAVLHIPAATEAAVTEGGNRLSNAVKFLRTEKGCAVFEVGSGRYSFQTQPPVL